MSGSSEAIRAARIGPRSLVREAVVGVGMRPGRFVTTVLATVIGIGSLVVVLGIGQTTAAQVGARFDSAAATHVEVAPTESEGADGVKHAVSTLPPDAVERIARLTGVESVAQLGDVELAAGLVTTVALDDPAALPRVSPPVSATTPQILAATGATIVTGRFFDDGHQARTDRVAVLGAGASDALGIHDVSSAPAVFLGGIAYTVIGIAEGFGVQPSLNDAIIIPDRSARADFGYAGPRVLVIEVTPGASSLVAHQAPIALASASPESFSATTPADVSVLSGGVRDDLGSAFLVVGGITLLAGGIGITGIMLLSVAQRASEIGLRRALGARRGDIAVQFLLETGLVGAIGGVSGAALGVMAIVAVAAVNGWSPVLDPLVVAGAVLAGAVLGLTSGGYPALRASRIEPAEALRSD